jgi:hypothetical protein
MWQEPLTAYYIAIRKLVVGNMRIGFGFIRPVTRKEYTETTAVCRIGSDSATYQRTNDIILPSFRQVSTSKRCRKLRWRLITVWVILLHCHFRLHKLWTMFHYCELSCVGVTGMFNRFIYGCWLLYWFGFGYVHCCSAWLVGCLCFVGLLLLKLWLVWAPESFILLDY